MSRRVQILVRGIVQGVGFRPFVFALAERGALRGQVRNNSIGVLIDLEGEAEPIDHLIAELKASPPPLARVESVEWRADLPLANYADFRIVESAGEGAKFVPLAPDIATCADCLRELFDPRDRRYRYPFINCTNCGPRFTIIEDVPYDRANTTMREFAMCVACRAEYEDPRDRRFHAEPTACPTCGPHLSLTDSLGHVVPLETEDAISHTRRLLVAGKLIALKGIGGFHLACDALNAAAVAELRRRKYREDKPFALMARSVEMIKEYCAVSPAEAELLLSASRPIVLLSKRAESIIPPAVAPGVRSLGFMLPYAPLHYLLLEELDRPLVLTSGNISDEPICYEDEDALERLRAIADYFLLHNRRIHRRTDDSIARVQAGRETILRRSRGYAPAPIKTSFAFAREILACGAELKNTFCLTREHYAFLSHHIGDLENLETLESFRQGIADFKQLFNLQPEVVAYDLHPEYLSTKYALALEDIATKVGVQHHHAHIASCLADNQIEGEVIGVALDGLGFGTDSRFWGGEFFVADLTDAERVAHLAYVPLPGGAQAVREPWRMAAIYLEQALGESFLDLAVPFVERLDRRKWVAIRRMAASGTNSPQTSSMGRLFDAVASLIGLRDTVRYEGQAAIELEMLADQTCAAAYDFDFIAEGQVISARRVIQQIVADLLESVPEPVIAAKFHQGLAQLIGAVAEHLRAERKLNRVALSGGVFQNTFLVTRVIDALQAAGFEVLTHRRVPCNDGGISLGQAAIAHARIMAGRI